MSLLKEFYTSFRFYPAVPCIFLLLLKQILLHSHEEHSPLIENVFLTKPASIRYNEGVVKIES